MTHPAAGLSGANVALAQLIALRHRGMKFLLEPKVARLSMAGPSRTAIRGRGMEYAESRAYLPGDEIKNMDWRVTARTGKPHTKLFQEERERPVILLVDLSPSMFFGTRRAFKSVVAAEAAALFAWAAMARGDRIGAVVAADGHHRELSPASGRRGVLRVLGAIAECAALRGPAGTPGPAVLADASARLRQIARPGSLICIISDHYKLSQDVASHIAKSCAHGDLIGVWVHDPLEVEPPPPGRYPITDGTTRGVIDSAIPGLRNAHRTHFETRRESVQNFYDQHHATLIELSTAVEVEEGLRQVLAAASIRATRHGR